MLVLFETASGYAVFKYLHSTLKKSESDYGSFADSKNVAKHIKLVSFEPFKDIAEAMASSTNIAEGSLCPKLKKMLKKVLKEEVDDKMLVLDSKLGKSINEKFKNLNTVTNEKLNELIRCIRGNVSVCIPGLTEQHMSSMMLGVGHHVSRFKLKFSPDKIDTMVVQAIGLLDDLDKQINNYTMKMREWYGWHYPELFKIVQTNPDCYLDVIIHGGRRTSFKSVDFTPYMASEMAAQVIETAEVSMGVDVTDEDLINMQAVSESTKGLIQYREELTNYVQDRMRILAPNVDVLVGHMIGARLLAHAGSLVNLAKYPSSTVQLIGAEKALFMALKTKKRTPKYGLLFQAQLVKDVPQKKMGTMARMLAAKVSLGARVDALADKTSPEFGAEMKVKLERSKTCLKNNIPFRPKGFNAKPKHLPMRGDEQLYKMGGDSTGFAVKRKAESPEPEEPQSKKVKTEELSSSAEPMETPGKKKKKKKDRTESSSSQVEEVPQVEEASEKTEKKKKKKNKDESLMETSQVEEPQEGEEKKKKKKKRTNEESPADESVLGDPTPEKKKKKKKKSQSEE